MKHSWEPSEAEQIAWLENRLSPDQHRQFEEWLSRNPEKAAELRDIQSLDADLSDLPMPQNSPDELGELRAAVMSAVREAAEEEQAPSPDLRLARRKSDQSSRRRFQWIPAAVAALVIGFLMGRQEPANLATGGALADGELRSARYAVDGAEPGIPAMNLPSKRQVAVQELDVESANRVRIQLNEVSSYELTGSLDDRDIQGALGFMLRNDRDPERRQKAIQLLDEHCEGQDVCDILVYALTEDPNPQVRKAAADALRDDQDNPLVRRSFLKMLMGDPSPELRGFAEDILSSEAEILEFGK